MTLIAFSKRLPRAAAFTATLLVSLHAHSQPAAEDHPTAASGIVIDAAHRLTAGLTVAAARPAEMEQTLRVYGQIMIPPEQLRRIRARYPGVVRSVAKTLGETVRAGETLAVIESNDSLRAYKVTSPIDGRLIERHVGAGEPVADDVLFVVADLSTVQAELQVFTRDLPEARQGTAAHISGTPGQFEADAPIVYVAPVSSGSGQTVSLRVRLDNASAGWVPGQFVTGEIVIARRDAEITVPASSLQIIDGKPTVFVDEAGGFVPRAVRTGLRDRQTVEILEGLPAGAAVAAGNTFLLKSELLTREED